MTLIDTKQHIIIFSVAPSGRGYSRTDVALDSGKEGGGSRFSSMKDTLSKNPAIGKEAGRSFEAKIRVFFMISTLFAAAGKTHLSIRRLLAFPAFPFEHCIYFASGG